MESVALAVDVVRHYNVIVAYASRRARVEYVA